MLLLGGAATVEALTGMDYRLASFFIPWGVILYTAAGGLKATFIASYLHTVIIFGVLVTMIAMVYVKNYSSDDIYEMLDESVTSTDEECMKMFSTNQTVATSFYNPDDYACDPVDGNNSGSYLTMLSEGGLMFGIINIIGNFGTVFVDQSYWQSAIAAKPASAAKGYLLGGICWFAIPFSLATSLGLSSTALMLPITAEEAGSGLVPPAVATHLMGSAGSGLILTMLFMAIVSTGSAESIAVSSLVSYDIYREYFNPNATGKQILFVSRIVIVVFGLLMGVLSIILKEIGLNLGWVYLFMGIMIGSAVVPLALMMLWEKASGTGAIIAAWVGLASALISWLVTAQIREGEISVDALGTNEVMLTGNLFAIFSSGIIHVVYSLIFPQEDFKFSELNSRIKLVENDLSGLSSEDQDPEELDKASKWIIRRGVVLTIVLIVIWPLLSIPAGKFTKAYFAFWVLVSIAWGFGAAIIITFLPLMEAQEDFAAIVSGISGKKETKSEKVDEFQDA